VSMSGEKRDKEPLAEAEVPRETFLTVLRSPMPTPGGVEVQGAVVRQQGDTSFVELEDGLILAFDSVELRAAIAPVAEARRAAA